MAKKRRSEKDTHILCDMNVGLKSSTLGVGASLKTSPVSSLRSPGVFFKPSSAQTAVSSPPFSPGSVGRGCPAQRRREGLPALRKWEGGGIVSDGSDFFHYSPPPLPCDPLLLALRLGRNRLGGREGRGAFPFSSDRWHLLLLLLFPFPRLSLPISPPSSIRLQIGALPLFPSLSRAKS